MDQNQFLRDFIKMRQELKAKEATYAAPSRRNNAPSPALVGQAVPKPSGMSLATIIEEKPPKSDVIKYLRQRVEQLMDEMSD